MLRKILIADDNINTRKRLQQLLQDQGYQVTAVGNGDLAFVKIREELPHMVMLDCLMPGKSGYEVCDLVKNDSVLNQIPVILTFSDNEPFDLAEARRVGATRCLPKLIDEEQLIAILDFIWAGVTPIEYPRTESPETDESYIVATAELVSMEPNGEGEYDPVSFEEEPSEAEPVSEEIAVEPVDEAPYRFEVKLEETEEVEVEPAEVPVEPLEIRAEHDSVEIPGLETKQQTAAHEKESVPTPAAMAATAGKSDSAPITNQATNPGEVLDSFNTGPHFKYTAAEESNEDLLQINDTLTATTCRECGARVIIGDVFCIECGAAVDEAVVPSPAKQHCEQCGDGINEGDVFCLNCGAVL